MSTLQNQITQSLEGLSNDSLSFILEMIQRFAMLAESNGMDINHDINECNDEIAGLFGVDD